MQSYLIVKSVFPATLELEVNQYIEKGYVPHGSLLEFEEYLIQPMVLKEVKDA